VPYFTWTPSYFAYFYSDNNDFENKFKMNFVSSMIYEFKGDTTWHDIIPCVMPDELDKEAVLQIDSMVKISFKNLWEYSDKGREFIGSRKDFAIDPNCLAEECLRVYHSKELDKLARSFGNRLKGKKK
jgi:hypothetical protein